MGIYRVKISDDDIVSEVKTAVIPIIEQMEQAFNEGNFMQADEIRYKEDMPALGLNWIRLGLDDVLYDPKTQLIYTPNTNAYVKMGEAVKNMDDDEQRAWIKGEHGYFVGSTPGGSAGGGVMHAPVDSGGGALPTRSSQKSDEKDEKSVDKTAKDDIIRKEFDEAGKYGKISTKVNKKQEAHKYGSNAYNERISKGEHPSYTKLSKMEIQQVINRNIETAEL